jgi:hypothetical protein
MFEPRSWESGLGFFISRVRRAKFGKLRWEQSFSELVGYPFEVRYSDGALARARAAADVAADAYVYFSRLFAAVEPDIAVSGMTS